MILITVFIYRNYSSVNIVECVDIMSEIEKQYSKKYPLGDDFFIIRHTPKYSSFFEQFDDYDYLTYSKDNNIFGTMCLAKINNLDAYYICDLKSLERGHNVTTKFFVYCFFNYSSFRNNRFFGIVMQPNKTIDNLARSSIFKKYCNLNLYRIEYRNIKKIDAILKKIFGNYYFVSGYKSLILESTNKPINLCHIATKNDRKYVKMQKKIYLDDMDDTFEIMFCIPSILSTEIDNYVEPTSIMSVFGYGMENTNWNFVRTYMI